ncbi:MAG: UvrB/UvrC motif-containing protein [Planctomycetota bacterium]
MTVVKCQQCGQSASVHVTELPLTAGTPPEESHFCDRCAEAQGLPAAQPKLKSGGSQIWKLLEVSARQARKQAGMTCPTCGMTLAEFRSKGRLGCAACYEAFWQHLEPLLLRVHNATQHQGRVPGADEAVLERDEAIHQLKSRLANAIRDEAYEQAAELRDELEQLESAAREPADTDR